MARQFKVARHTYRSVDGKMMQAPMPSTKSRPEEADMSRHHIDAVDHHCEERLEETTKNELYNLFGGWVGGCEGGVFVGM